MAPSLGSINLLTEFLGLLAYYKRYRGIPEEEMDKARYVGSGGKAPIPSLCIPPCQYLFMFSNLEDHQISWLKNFYRA
jgi:hypothetical protein